MRQPGGGRLSPSPLLAAPSEHRGAWPRPEGPRARAQAPRGSPARRVKHRVGTFSLGPGENSVFSPLRRDRQAGPLVPHRMQLSKYFLSCFADQLTTQGTHRTSHTHAHTAGHVEPRVLGGGCTSEDRAMLRAVRLTRACVRQRSPGTSPCHGEQCRNLILLSHQRSPVAAALFSVTGAAWLTSSGLSFISMNRLLCPQRKRGTLCRPAASSNLVPILQGGNGGLGSLVVCPQITHQHVAEASFESRPARPEILLVTLFLQQSGQGANSSAAEAHLPPVSSGTLGIRSVSEMKVRVSDETPSIAAPSASLLSLKSWSSSTLPALSQGECGHREGTL